MEVDFQKQINLGVEATKNIKLDTLFKRVIFCGMGGSAIPGEIVSMLWLENLSYYINREARLPFWANKENLVVCVSWSGNTEETINCLKEAVIKKIPAVVMTKGGRLAETAKSSETSLVILPIDEIPARFGVGYMTAALLTLLNNFANIGLNVSDTRISGPKGNLDLVSKIGSKVPLVYSSYQWRFLARFWKIHFNESCKIHAFANFLPESAHNEIAAFSSRDAELYFPIILKDAEENSYDIAKLEKLSDFFSNLKIDHEVISLNGSSRFEKIFNNYSLATNVSLELALRLNQDPFNNSSIEKFKNN